jgi:hypothetical protein
MHEYDVYADARRTIPRLREALQTLDGEYYLVKVDPLAQTMTFSTSKGAMVNLTTLPIWRVKEIIAINRAGEKAETLLGDSDSDKVEEPTYRHEEDSITRFDSKSKRNKRNKRRGNKERSAEGAEQGDSKERSGEQGDSKERSGERGEKQEKPQGAERGAKQSRQERGERHSKQERQERGERATKEQTPKQERGEQSPEGERHGEGEERRQRDNRRQRHGRGRRHGERAHREQGGEQQSESRAQNANKE